MISTLEAVVVLTALIVVTIMLPPVGVFLIIGYILATR